MCRLNSGEICHCLPPFRRASGIVRRERELTRVLLFQARRNLFGEARGFADLVGDLYYELLAGVRPADGRGSCLDASPLYLRMVQRSRLRPEAFLYRSVQSQLMQRQANFYTDR